MVFYESNSLTIQKKLRIIYAWLKITLKAICRIAPCPLPLALPSDFLFPEPYLICQLPSSETSLVLLTPVLTEHPILAGSCQFSLENDC